MNHTLTIQAIDDDSDDLCWLEELLWEIPNIHVNFQGFRQLDAGLAALKDNPGDVLFLDFRLGAKTGVEAFKDIQEIGYLNPVILLTGHGDERIAVQALKEGMADYLTKATLTAPTLQRTIFNALEKHRLRQQNIEQKLRMEAADRELLRRIRSEKEVLEETLIGSLEAMTHVLSIMNPEVFNRSIRITRYATAIAKQLNLSVTWKLEVAALLSQIGFITFPPELLHNLARGRGLSHQETLLYHQYPSIGAEMIRKIPRMEKVADIIEYQEDTLDETTDSIESKIVPFESRILKVAIDLDGLESTGHTKQQALDTLRQHAKKYDPAVLNALRALSSKTLPFKTKEVAMADLNPSMILAEDIRAKSGAIVLPKGQPVTFTMLTRLHNFSLFQPIREPIQVLLPVTTLHEELELATGTD
ncbi:HD-GYP domain-containing protein [Candidatus Nitronereus thalassa]|uniref:Response regulator n=1 Tax=Candidatus Nitronereus thalassa TaxID=3020898 RepID=A0ABU3KB30_9BACT|nr:HD domain-containing phosphohydrolase [Candidatus Nitronereus thalassa]MDT7043631.1 response regulator [Candidatus Nitronereus thalassa]